MLKADTVNVSARVVWRKLSLDKKPQRWLQECLWRSSVYMQGHIKKSAGCRATYIFQLYPWGIFRS